MERIDNSMQKLYTVLTDGGSFFDSPGWVKPARVSASANIIVEEIGPVTRVVGF